MKISARAFQRVFSCKISFRYSRERALKSSNGSVPARRKRRADAQAGARGRARGPACVRDRPVEQR